MIVFFIPAFIIGTIAFLSGVDIFTALFVSVIIFSSIMYFKYLISFVLFPGIESKFNYGFINTIKIVKIIKNLRFDFFDGSNVVFSLFNKKELNRKKKIIFNHYFLKIDDCYVALGPVSYLVYTAFLSYTHLKNFFSKEDKLKNFI